MIQDTNRRYGAVSKILHWFMALLIGWQLLKIGDRFEEGEHWIGQTLVPWHVSIGTLLLGFIVLRLFWALTQRGHRPKQHPNTAALVGVAHALLYAGMLLLPITGVMIMLGGGHGLSAFGIEIVAEGDGIPWAASVGDLHSPLAWALLVLVTGHITIALYHHVVRKDDVLTRML